MGNTINKFLIFIGTGFFAYLVLIFTFGFLASSPSKPEYHFPAKKAIVKRAVPSSVGEIERKEDEDIISYHQEVEGKRWGLGVSFHADPYEIGKFAVTHGYLMYVLAGGKVTEALYAASPIDFDIGFKMPISKNKNLILTLPVTKIPIPLIDMEDKRDIINGKE
jgi:hypothetical protein